jgi:secreted trypsin-like serine protease
LIAPDLVLTAAQCAGRPDVQIVLNPHKLSDPIKTLEVFSVEDYVIHPFYQTLARFDHDYMIIKLTGSSSLPTVRLNINDNLPVTGSSLQVLGWGTSVAGKDVEADSLQEVDGVAITNEECSNTYSTIVITPDMLCVAEVNKGSCQVDGGGPLVIPGSSPDEDIQIGIPSRGINCGSNLCKLFRRVSSCSAF